MTTETFTEQALSVDVSDDGPEIVVTWRGRSTAREPGKFLRPILTRQLEKAALPKRALVLDFRAVEFFNSSTITPVIRLLEEARKRGASVVIRYRKDLRWQELSFSALKVFVGADDRIRIEGA